MMEWLRGWNFHTGEFDPRTEESSVSLIFSFLFTRFLLLCFFFIFAEIPNDRVCCTLMMPFANAVNIAHFN